jgi:amino acid transporter
MQTNKELTWIDCSALIITIILGAGIFTVFPKLAAAHNPSVLMILLSWVVGAFIAWCGAMCYAELACLFPKNGGDYLFLREAYPYRGKMPLSFLFGWTQIFVIRPASLVSLAIIFGINAEILFRHYCETFCAGVSSSAMSNNFLTISTLGVLVLFTGICIIGLKTSKWVLNGIVCIKLLCVMLLICVGLYKGKDLFHNLTPLIFPKESHSFLDMFKNLGMALIPIMWVFGGWNEAPYIAEELKDPIKNIPKALTVGLLSLGCFYLVLNFVYLLHLTPAGLANSWTFASDLMRLWFGPKGEVVMASIILISVAGAINGLTFTGGRMTAAFSKDFPGFQFLVHRTHKTPVAALSFNLILGFTVCGFVQCKADSIDNLLNFTAGVFWFFIALVVFSVFLFRKRYPVEKFSFRMPLFPWTPIIFLIMCGFMLWGVMDYKPKEALCGIGIVLLGIPIYYLTTHLTALIKNRKV